MAVRSILEIEINDSAFRAFQDKFNAYQAQLKELPGEWGKVSQTMAGLSGIMQKMETASKAGPSNAMMVGKVTVDTKKIAADYALLWTGISKSSHFFLYDVIGATQHLTKWTALTGVFAGLLGAGGLFGISRLAMGAAGQRQSAMGLGVSTGQYSSFIVNAGTLTSDPAGLLSKFSESFYGQGARSDFASAFGSGIGSRMQGKNAESFFADILPDLKRKLDTVPEAQLGNYLKSSHLANRGIDVETARRIRAMSTADVGALSGRLATDAAAMNMPDEATKKLQELDTKLLETWNILSADVETKLTPLTPSLTKLTDSFGKFADKALEKGGSFDVVLKEAASDIGWLADQLGTDEGRAKLLEFAKDAAVAAVTFEVLAKAIGSATAVSSAYGAWKVVAGVLTWVPAVAALGGAFAAGAGFLYATEGEKLSRPEDIYKPGEGKPTLHQQQIRKGMEYGPQVEGHIPAYARGTSRVTRTQLAVVHKGAETSRSLAEAE
jgi:hypothetical protein